MFNVPILHLMIEQRHVTSLLTRSREVTHTFTQIIYYKTKTKNRDIKFNDCNSFLNNNSGKLSKTLHVELKREIPH